MNALTEEAIRRFAAALAGQERAPATVAKYVRAVRGLAAFLGGKAPEKARLIAYRDRLLETASVQTVNGHLSAINAYLAFSGSGERLTLLKFQRRAFLPPERELDEGDYHRLLAAAQRRGDQRLYHVMLTLGGTGIRVSELPFVTVEAARAGSAEIRLKGKTRLVLLPKELRKRLLTYAKERKIDRGPIFVTRTGRPLDRSNLCHALKALSREARVDSRKVFPHSFRHLFARAFFAVEKNLAHLADVLGHSSIETTRIYVAASAAAYERTLRKMRLII